MKLYTEYEIYKAFRLLVSKQFLEGTIDGMKSIELPSDEEIWNEGKLVFSEKGKTIYTHYNTVPSWSDGAKWMRDKIGGNNEQE